MKKVLITALLVVLVSCAPLIEKDKCQFYYKKVLETSYQEEPIFIRGNIFVHGAYLIFHGNFNKNSSIVVRTPFGKKLFSIEYMEDNICIKTPNREKLCGKNLDIYGEYLNIRLPIDLKQILTGRFKLDKNAFFQCSEKGITVINKGVKISYRGDRPVKVEYNGFLLLYSYHNGRIKKITVKREGKEILKIYIREMIKG